MIDLTGKRALVCGCTQGMGRACAVELARQGAEVTLAARSEPALQQVLTELSAAPGQNHGYIAHDFADPFGLHRKVADHVQRRGPIHILLNNTGGPPGGEIAAAKPDDFRKALEMHLIANHLLAQTLLPGMKEAGYGRIINIISISVKTPIPWLGVSNTTRWAVASWAKTLAGEVARFGITVNNVLPGYIATGRLESLIQAKAAKAGQTPDQMRAALCAEVPAGRIGRPEEIAAAVAFLASPAASYINGVNLPVDGGRSPTL